MLPLSAVCTIPSVHGSSSIELISLNIFFGTEDVQVMYLIFV